MRRKERVPWRPGVKRILGRTTYSKLRIVLTALAVALVTVAPAASAPDVPNLVGPNDGDTVAFLPVFSWDPVAGADKYNFVLSADSAFNSPVYQLNGTKNTRSTPDKTVPNGTYYWRVQAVDTDGNTSGWSETRQIEKLWADSPALTAPDDAAIDLLPRRAARAPVGAGPRRRQVPHLHCLRSGPRLPRD